MSQKVGKITQIIGPVIDVLFEKDLPALYNALTVQNGDETLVMEVQQKKGGKETCEGISYSR